MSEVASVVEVDPTEFRKEWHNYARLMITIAAGCLIAFVGSYFVNSQWQARTDEKIVNLAERTQVHEKQIDVLNQYQAQINGRLGVIEERTQNTNDALKRIEGKLDK